MLNTQQFYAVFLPIINPLVVRFILLGIFLYLFVVIIRELISIKYRLFEKYTFLQIKPSDRTLKSPLSTKQLFTVLHSLEKPKSIIERLFKIKKTISYELVSTKEDGIRFVFRIPDKDTSAIKKTLLAYLPDVQITKVNDYLPNFNKNNLATIKTIKISNKFIYPLQDQSSLNQYDPIAYITAHMTKLSPDEMISLQFACSPVSSSTHFQISNQVESINKAFLNNEDISSKLSTPSLLNLLPFQFLFDSLLFIALLPITLISWLVTNEKEMFPNWVFEHKKKRLSDLGNNKLEIYRSIKEKINQPLFEVTIRVFVDSKSNKVEQERISGIVSSFETFSTPDQSLILYKPFFRNLLHNKTIHQFQFMLFKNRINLLTSKTILSVLELSSIYHLPYTETTKTEDLIQTKSPKLPAPLSLKKLQTNLDITFATNTYGETTVPIGLTMEERRRHVYVLGATGTGKTTLLLQMLYQDIQKGNGLAIVDPHGDLTERLLNIIPKKRIKDVVYVNPYDIEFPLGLNVLEIPKGLSQVELQREKDFITSTLISIFHKLYDARYSGPRMEHILRNVILTALEQEDPTIFTIYKLLTDKKYRKNIVANLNDEVLQTFWKNEFEKQGSYQQAEQISPITNKLGRFLTTSMTRNILNQTKSKLDFEDIMNNKKILICNLSKGKIGEDTAYFLGSLVIAKIQLTALRRVHKPEKERIDFFLYIDEFQNFATQSFAEILSEARKYRLAVTLAHQNTVQIDSQLLETIIGNSGTLICFRTSSPQDEFKLLPIFTPQVEKGQIANLPSYSFYMKINAIQPQNPFTGEIDDFTIQGSSDIRNKVIKYSQDTYGQKQLVIETKKVPDQVINKSELKQEPLHSENFFEQMK